MYLNNNNFGNAVDTRIPKWLMIADMTPLEKLIYIYITDKVNYCSDLFSQNYIANRLKCARETVNRAIRRLCKKQLISKTVEIGKTAAYSVCDSTLSEFVIATCKENNAMYIIENKDKIQANGRTSNEQEYLTPNERFIKECVLEVLGLELTPNKIKILVETATADGSTTNVQAKEIISECADRIKEEQQKQHIKNPFGYLKKMISNRQRQSNVEFDNAAVSLSAKLNSEYPPQYRFSPKQCNALLKMTEKKIIQTGKSQIDAMHTVIEIIGRASCKSKGKIKDTYRYCIKMINEYGNDGAQEGRSEYKRPETSYDINEFESFAVTLSKNTKAHINVNTKAEHIPELITEPITAPVKYKNETKNEKTKFAGENVTELLAKRNTAIEQGDFDLADKYLREIRRLI